MDDRQAGEIEAEFICSACKKIAATVVLVPPNTPLLMGAPFSADQALRSRDWCLWKSAHSIGWVVLAPDNISAVRMALKTRSGKRLFSLDPDTPSHYCRECDCWYCADHWSTTAHFDNVDGTCPHGHKRVLED